MKARSPATAGPTNHMRVGGRLQICIAFLYRVSLLVSWGNQYRNRVDHVIQKIIVLHSNF